VYLKHFGLSEYPFSLTPDTSYFFDYTSHREALNVLLVALRAGEGFIKVTGEVGLGKTLLCRKLLASLGEEFVTAYMPDPQLTPMSMRLALAEELGLSQAEAGTQEQILRRITRRLIEHAREGRRVVLLLDEAQQLPEATLEGVRLLTNLETEKFKLLQVVLFGQPELEKRLDRPSIRQLRQRISFSYELKPLTRQASDAYIEHRLRVAGLHRRDLFTRGALRVIYRGSGGTPRLVNILAHKCLMLAFGRGLHSVTPAMARRALRDTEGAHAARWRPPARFARVAGVLMAAGLFLFAGVG
jgi:MSHA biogenesis protein MshM